jgi:hypothetical protein
MAPRKFLAYFYNMGRNWAIKIERARDADPGTFLKEEKKRSRLFL